MFLKHTPKKHINKYYNSSANKKNHRRISGKNLSFASSEVVFNCARYRNRNIFIYPVFIALFNFIIPN